MLKIVRKATQFAERTAIISNGKSYSYSTLLNISSNIANSLLNGKLDLSEERIAFMVDPSFDYVSTQWGIWRAGGIAVPLCVLHPLPSLRYVLEDTKASTLIVSEKYAELLSPLAEELNIKFLQLDGINTEKDELLPSIGSERKAMILYTSGTTNNPKGVVTTHQNIEAQIGALVEAWEWQAEDHILNILPLHHVHGIVNVLCCALWSGACCEFLPKFDAAQVWKKFGEGQLTLFMAVPTIYFKLMTYWEQALEEDKIQMSSSCKNFRLMVSGSAALPVSVLERWKGISGHTLLERYGMTEIGMGLSNSYRGERRPGHVGLPLPGVDIRLVDEQDKIVKVGTVGEIQVKGPGIFLEYWQKEAATKKAFTADGWFRTGDIAIFNDGSYKILGRNSVDIIKSGGYKISALEIEEVLRKHGEINECAVVGLPDEEWGEVIAASLITDNANIDFEALKLWLKERLPGYKVPRRFIIQKDLPRNTLGKVTKNELKKLFQ